MSSTNKTELGFNQWITTDKPVMEDFNADNLLTEELLEKRYTKTESDARYPLVENESRSLLLNPYFSINQRGKTSYAITADQWTYFADRWRAKTASGSASITRNAAGGWEIPAGVTIQQMVEAEQAAQYQGKAAMRGSIIDGVFSAEAFTITGPVLFERVFMTAATITYGDVVLGNSMPQALPVRKQQDLFWCQRYCHPVDTRLPAAIVVNAAAYFYYNTPCKMRVAPTFGGEITLRSKNWTTIISNATTQIYDKDLDHIVKTPYNNLGIKMTKDGSALGLSDATLVLIGWFDAEIYD